MAYKVLKNTTYEDDCYLCIFRGSCTGECPLKVSWYFGSPRSKKTDIVDVWKAK